MLVWESTLINVHINSWRAKNMSAYISCSKVISKKIAFIILLKKQMNNVIYI